MEGWKVLKHFIWKLQYLSWVSISYEDLGITEEYATFSGKETTMKCAWQALLNLFYVHVNFYTSSGGKEKKKWKNV